MNTKITEMLKNENVDFQEFYDYLRKEDIGNWDEVNDDEIIKQYCSEMMEKGIPISHIIKAIEKNPSKEDLYGIWLGNSMETPTPINTKKDLVEALGLEE